MKIFKDLEIGFQGTLEELADLIKVDLVENWKRAEEHDVDDGILDYPLICFQYNGPLVDQTASLFITVKEQGMFYVPNIVPEKKYLTKDEYNRILDSFYENIQGTLEKGIESINLSDDEILFEEIVPEDIQKAFFAFSRLANKSTGSTHPLDKKRWFDFICLVHGKRFEMDHDLMQSKLVEEGWSEDRAFDLIIEFEFGIGLLNHCN